MPSQKITKTSVEQLAVKQTLWDTELKGFGVRKQKDCASFILKTRLNGKQVFLTIGRYGQPWTPTTARDRARELLYDIAKGVNPNEVKKAQAESQTLADLFELYLVRHAEIHKKPKSAQEDRSLIQNWLNPLLGSKRVQDVNSQHIAKALTDVSDGKGGSVERLKGGKILSNRAHSLLNKAFNLAEEWGERPLNSNPCTHWKKFKETKKERYLSQDELARLGGAMRQANERQSEHPSSLLAIALLLSTGARKSEILCLKWTEINFETGFLQLADSKTGAKNIPLGEAAMKLIQSAPRSPGSDYVCFGEVAGRLGDSALRGAWERLCKQANICGCRLHDLRHTAASIAASAGVPLAVLGGVLGH